MSSRAEARLERLRDLTANRGAVRLVDAAAALGVSGMTLRRDLAAPGAGVELLGGYVVARGTANQPYALDIQQGAHQPAKAEAGRRAAALVASGDTLFVDCGTTTPHLIAALPADLEATIVCFSLNIAVLAARLPRVQLYLLGGLFQRSAETFLSDEALQSLVRLGIGKAFFSAGGVHDIHGVTCSNFAEVPVKQAVLIRAARTFLVVDSSKRGLIKPAHFAAEGAFERVVTEER